MSGLFDRQTFPVTCSQGHTTEMTPPELRASTLLVLCKTCGEDVSRERRKTLQIIVRCELVAETELAKVKRGE
jgi:hypothetical protein